jgi:uncharacterized protein (DUF1697 family)
MRESLLSLRKARGERPSKMPASYLALLRGINVGGKNKILMTDLSAMFVKAGCKNVRTFIQSGNVIFDSSAKVSAQVPRLVAEQITKTLGYKTPVVLRSLLELENAVASSPFLKPDAVLESLHVLFLAGLPEASNVAALDPQRSPGDEYIVRGREIYLRLTTGAADTKLTNAYFDSKLATISTGRNWRTVTKLLELMKS